MVPRPRKGPGVHGRRRGVETQISVRARVEEEVRGAGRGRGLRVGVLHSPTVDRRVHLGVMSKAVHRMAVPVPVVLDSSGWEVTPRRRRPLMGRLRGHWHIMATELSGRRLERMVN